MESISVYVCDDHQLMIDGLSSILSDIEGIHVIASGKNGKELLDWLGKNTTDVILLDINMPIIDGLTACREVNIKYPLTHVIFLSMYNEMDIIHSILESKAKGYLLKNSGKETVERAIRVVMSGGKFFEKHLSIVKSSKESFNRKYKLAKISKRELEVLKLITLEFTSIEISKKLFISPGTVDTHRRNMISKLGVKNTAGLVRIAVEQNLLL